MGRCSIRRLGPHQSPVRGDRRPPSPCLPGWAVVSHLPRLPSTRRIGDTPFIASDLTMKLKLKLPLTFTGILAALMAAALVGIYSLNQSVAV